mgnify:CR=1 FL=1
MNEVRILNADWAKEKYAYTADRIDVRINLLSLFRDRPTIHNVKMYDVKVNVEQNSDGKYSVPSFSKKADLTDEEKPLENQKKILHTGIEPDKIIKKARRFLL